MNKTAFILTFTLLTLAAPPARANDPYFSLCTDIQKARAQVHTPGFFKTIWDLLRLEFAPGSVVRLQESHVVTPPAEFIAQVAPLPANAGENIIFSIEPPTDVTAAPDFAAMQARYKALNARMKHDSKSLLELVKPKTLAGCISRAHKIKFDYAAYMKLAGDYQALHVVRQAEDAKDARKAAKKALGRVKLRWTYFPATDLGTVFQALRTRSVRNVVIISHGMSGGKLVDSRLNEYPLSFFSDLAPNLESLAIFACHGDETVGTYKIVEALKSFPSFHPQRMVIVSKGATLFGVPDSVPMAAFPSFMKKVDQRIRKLQKSAARARPTSWEAPKALCAATFYGLAVTQGTLGLVLNGKFIGTVDVVDPANPRLQFPCSWLDRSKNILVLKSLGLYDNAALRSLDVTAGIVYPGHEISELQLTNYFKPGDHAYQSSKFTFGIR